MSFSLAVRFPLFFLGIIAYLLYIIDLIVVLDVGCVLFALN